jgi:lysozyme
MPRHVNAATVALVQKFEGYKDKAYLCPAKVWTIGYGHTGPEVQPGMVCTKRQAEIWLGADLSLAGNRIRRLIGPVTDELTENQYGALCSFVFNLGASPGWTLWKVLKARNFDAVPAQLVRFVNAGGKKLPGLVRRRNAEIELWSTDEPGTHDRVLPSSTTRNTETPPAPAAEAKPLAKSKTMWAGATVAVSGAVEGARQVQAIVAPQAAYSDYVANLGGVVAAVIVAGGVAVMVFRYLDARKAKT